MNRFVHPAIFLILSIILIPASAQNVSLDDQELQIREEIAECEKEVRENDSMSEAEKTVAVRNCPSEIRKKYEQQNYDYRLAQEIKAKLQNIQRCEDWHEQYRHLSDELFMIQKNFEQASDCIKLYNDEIWQYEGDDRAMMLVERLAEIKSQEPQIKSQEPQIELVTITPEVNQTESVPLFSYEEQTDRIKELEGKVVTLEEEMAKKDAIIQEQINVILDLANKVRNAVAQIASIFNFMQI